MSIKFQAIEQLSQLNAEEIANDWHYDGIYSFYDMEKDPEDYEEIVSPSLRKNNYYQVLDEKGELVAFFCLEPDNLESKVEVGLGLKPSLTGKGLGRNLMKTIENYVRENTDYQEILLSVAEFN